MDSLLNCGTGGWLMIAGGALSYGVLVLAGAALIKYLISGWPKGGQRLGQWPMGLRDRSAQAGGLPSPDQIVGNGCADR